MWNHLKSLSNQVIHGHKGRHFNRTELEIGQRLLDLKDGSNEYEATRKLVSHLSDREVSILQGVALGQRNRKSVKEIMRQNRLSSPSR